jgi:hypothetical protein
VAEGAPFFLRDKLNMFPQDGLTGGAASVVTPPGSESFYIYLLEARSPKINSGDVSDDIFNPKQVL